jgi:hypothetical protein
LRCQRFLLQTDNADVLKRFKRLLGCPCAHDATS